MSDGYQDFWRDQQQRDLDFQNQQAAQAAFTSFMLGHQQAGTGRTGDDRWIAPIPPVPYDPGPRQDPFPDRYDTIAPSVDYGSFAAADARRLDDLRRDQEQFAQRQAAQRADDERRDREWFADQQQAQRAEDERRGREWFDGQQQSRRADEESRDRDWFADRQQADRLDGERRDRDWFDATRWAATAEEARRQAAWEGVGGPRPRDDTSSDDDPSGLAGVPMVDHSAGAANLAFMEDTRRTIVDGPDHPLRAVLDGEGDWLARRADADVPTVQAGHLISRHSGREERFALEDSTFNQLSNHRGETQGSVFVKSAVEIAGVAVERRTAEMWQRTGLVPPGTVAHAPPHPGWTQR